jgi:hypothetical protein
MNKPNDGTGIPREVMQKLIEIRNEDRRISFRAGLLRALAIFITAMLAAMIIDWLAIMHDRHWRWTLTLVAIVCGATALVQGCILPLFRRRSIASIAGEVDRAHPNLEERLLTLAEFGQSQDPGELRGSKSMLDKVAQQAAEMSRGISAASVISRAGLARAARYLCGATAALLLLFLVNYQQTRILFHRFWSPGADLTMTQLLAKNGDMVIGKGDDVTLEFTAKGKVSETASLDIRTGSHHEVIPMRRASAGEAKYDYAMNAVNDSFEYRARSGDGETAWHKVTVMERPKISEVKMRIVPPAYSHLPTVDETSLPRQVRALEGSRMEVSFKSDQPLSSMELKFGDGKSVPVTESADHTYTYQAELTNTMAFKPVFTNMQRLDNSPKPTCQVVVYPDQPPTVNMITPNNDITARPDDKVKIDFEAKDDFGIAKAEMDVTIKGETNSTSFTVPIPLTKEEAGSRKFRKQVELDLAKLNLKQDQELTYVVRVTDTKENSSTSMQESPESKKQQEQAQNESKAESKKNASNQQPSKSEAAKANKPGENQNKPQDNKQHIAMNAPKPSDSKPKEPSEGAKRPESNMGKRVLDAGQCSACQPRKIVVDQWGRSFEGQMRDKLEIAIDPVLKQLDALLGRALQLTDDTLASGKREGLSQKQSPAVEDAKDNLRQADSAVSDLKKICHGTPYAFVSLQIDDIREAYMSPARKELSGVALETATAKADIAHLEQGSFQIKTARQKLADLTKSYEAIKRDNKLADAMQRLAKMHQIFLEDTQAMLGSSKPILNPQQRKIAEVSDEFAEKLKKLLEEKKKILDELAKILSEDPRLLRRYMALEQLDSTTLRDQMTLLAERQRTLGKQSAQWTTTSDQNRKPFLDALMSAQSSEQTEIAELASKMLENVVTWAPLDIPADKEPIAGLRKIATDATRFATEAAQHTTPETLNAGLASASNALEQLHQFQAALPGLDWVTDSKENVSAFEANRQTETSELITRQSGWIKKMESIRAGDYAQAAEVDQHRLMLDTATLGEKLDSTAISVGHLSPEIKAKADELNHTVHSQILTEENGATQALGQKTVPDAAKHQAQATNAFATGEQQFDDLLHLIIAKLDAEPAPTDPNPNKSLEQILAMLNDEKKACEKLGIPCRPLNISIEKDWMKACSCPNGSAQARAAQAQSKEAKAKAEKNQKQAAMLVKKEIDALPPAQHPNAPKVGPKPAPTGWNTLVSQLGDELRQGRDNVPPEQYRQAIEQYFSTISEKPSEPSGGTK